jgi:NDP-sugar pyrophosphorylase family protein
VKAVILAGGLSTDSNHNDVIKKTMNRKKLVSSFITKKGFTDIGYKKSYKKYIKNIFKNKARTEK